MITESTIGKISQETGVNPKTVRYYEEIGLLPRVRRNGSGYRVYSHADRERLSLIKRAKLLGLSLAETKELVRYGIDGQCAVLESRLARMLEQHLAEIDRRIEDLTRLRADMREYHRNLQARIGTPASQFADAPPAVCRCIEGAEERGSDDKTTATGLGTGRTGRRRRKEEPHERPGKERASV